MNAITITDAILSGMDTNEALEVIANDILEIEVNEFKKRFPLSWNWIKNSLEPEKEEKEERYIITTVEGMEIVAQTKGDMALLNKENVTIDKISKAALVGYLVNHHHQPKPESKPETEKYVMPKGFLKSNDKLEALKEMGYWDALSQKQRDWFKIDNNWANLHVENVGKEFRVSFNYRPEIKQAHFRFFTKVVKAAGHAWKAHMNYISVEK